MGKKFIFFVLGFAGSQFCLSQNPGLSPPAISALGKTTATYKGEWAVFTNPAGLQNIEQMSILFSMGNGNSIPGILNFSGGIVVPLKKFDSGMGYSFFGDGTFNKQKLSFGISHSMGITTLGVRTGFVQYHIEGYGTKAVPTIDFGGITRLSEKFYIGAYGFNLNFPSVSEELHFREPLLLGTGIQFIPTEHSALYIDLVKEINRPLSLRTGIQYSLIEAFRIKTGFHTEPSSYSIGFSMGKSRFKTDYSYSSGFIFGGSHQWGLTISFR
ncbi:MAG: hypothetical protein OEY34_05800 [Cyclobacteriaceae bacterium]|nr:hypothetical protein [Cyclobacteriaceae bacterium]